MQPRCYLLVARYVTTTSILNQIAITRARGFKGK